ncbi:MAG: 2,4-diaminopentanoate dehydrogenase [Acholeplasmataceae bacterium]|nr:2,4-diaminopentanoate dehydrogenase [Acholeplasmataceae bacterium]
MQLIKVAIWGFGAMGQGMAEMLLTKRGVDIVGVCDINENFVGKTVEDILKSDYQCQTPIEQDIDSMLDNTKPDLVLLCTDSFVKGAYHKIEKILKKKINCITTAEEMAYPLESHPEMAKAFDDLAKENGVTLLGTGINPGFIMDLMVVALSGAMVDVEKIKVERINSLSPFGPAVMEEQGVGDSLERYHERVKNNQLDGHVGFRQSVDMIFKGLGLKPSKFEQQMKPILTSIDRQTKYATAKKGTLAGVNMTAQGYLENQLFLEMSHPQQIEPEAEGVRTGDYIYLTGKPNVQMAISPEIDGGLGTIAVCVNMIPHVLNARPGLKTMLDLPVPRAILGDMRDMLDITK